MKTGKTKLLFLGCNKLQVPYLLKAKKLGFYIIATDINTNVAGSKIADKFYPVSYEDSKSLIQIGIKEKFNQNDKVFTAASQFAYIGAADFASYFGIHFIPVQTVNICLDKSKLYLLLNRLSLPVPKFYFCRSNKCILKIIIDNPTTRFYIKSDYSKNPNYIYISSNNKIPKINFAKDRYLRRGYIVQKEIMGQHIRVNCWQNQFIYYIHSTGAYFFCNHKLAKFQKQIQADILKISNHLILYSRIIKIDIITNDNGYFFLDIGLDPPQRLKVLMKHLKYDFAEIYLKQCLGFNYTYPALKKLVNQNILVSHRKIKYEA